MADDRCPHARLDYLDPLQRRGWACTECGESGPTVVTAAEMESHRGRVLGVQLLCMCGSGWQWPLSALGIEVTRYLAEHAGCTERRRPDADPA